MSVSAASIDHLTRITDGHGSVSPFDGLCGFDGHSPAESCLSFLSIFPQSDQGDIKIVLDLAQLQ